MGNKNNSNRYFRIYLANRDLLLSLDDETLANGIRAAIRYFDQFEVVDIDNLEFNDPLQKLVFTALKQGCDDSIKSYKEASKSANKRWHPDKTNDDNMQSITPL